MENYRKKNFKAPFTTTWFLSLTSVYYLPPHFLIFMQKILPLRVRGEVDKNLALEISVASKRLLRVSKVFSRTFKETEEVLKVIQTILRYSNGFMRDFQAPYKTLKISFGKGNSDYCFRCTGKLSKATLKC